MINAQTLAALENAPLSEIRRHVRGTLERTGSFRELPATDRRKVAHDLVRVLSYLTDPYGGQPELAEAQAAPAARPTARGLDAVEVARRNAANLDHSSKQFNPAANKTLTDTTKNLVQAVDFPQFVSSLIDGVFTSIVNTTIKQMQEFGKFLDGVTKTLDQFAKENVSPDDARDFLRNQHPDAFQQKPGPLALLDSFADGEMPDFKSIFGAEEPPDLTDEDIEKAVARTAQLQLAKMRQQQLAAMVTLGINRIVVTEGEIKATVQFDVSASDRASKHDADNFTDTNNTVDNSNRWSGSWNRDRNSWDYRGGNTVTTRVTTTNASTSQDTDTKLDAKAKLTGFVSVKFKSETFPVERLASPGELGAIQEKSQR